MSKFEPGQSGNLNGRPKGSENIASGKVRELWQNLLLDNLSQLTKDFKALEGKDRLNIAVKISSFILPKLQSIEIQEYPQWLELVSMPKEDRLAEITRLKQEIENGEEG